MTNEFLNDSKTADFTNPDGSTDTPKEPRYRCSRCYKEGTEKQLDRFFCSDIPFSCYQARAHMECYECEELVDNMNDWAHEPEYDGGPNGHGTCRECKEKKDENSQISK